MLKPLMGWAADRPVTVGMACLSLGVLAVFDATQASIELVPDLTCPRVDVRLAWPGAAPRELFPAGAQQAKRIGFCTRFCLI